MKARHSATQVQEALAASHGNISEAAAVLGIARNNLYKRIMTLGVDLEALRRSAPPRRPSATPRPSAPKRPGPRRQLCSLYLRPEQFKALTEASFDLTPILRERLSLSKVLEMFMDAAFAGWVSRVCGKPVAGS